MRGLATLKVSVGQPCEMRERVGAAEFLCWRWDIVY
jgi:hypothetical protein